MNRIEEVKKIEAECDSKLVWCHTIDEARKTVAYFFGKLYQLFPQPLPDEELRKKCLSALSPKEVTDAIYTKSGKIYPTAFYRLRKAQVDKDLAILQQWVTREP